MRGSECTFGKGGLYSITGWYHNRPLGAYRAYVTDPKCAVVLVYEERTVVVSPAEAEDFLRDLDLFGTHDILGKEICDISA